MPVSKDFLVRFRLPRGISETNSQNFQIFLATGRLFAENLARILGRVKGFGLPPHPGGGLFLSRFRPWPWPCVRGPVLSCFRPCGACLRPRLRPVHLQKIGLPWGLNWVLSVRPFGRSREAFIISLACVPCQVGNKGRKFAYLLPIFCLSFAIPLHVLCNPFACPL